MLQGRELQARRSSSGPHRVDRGHTESGRRDWGQDARVASKCTRGATRNWDSISEEAWKAKTRGSGVIPRTYGGSASH